MSCRAADFRHFDVIRPVKAEQTIEAGAASSEGRGSNE